MVCNNIQGHGGGTTCGVTAARRLGRGLEVACNYIQGHGGGTTCGVTAARRLGRGLEVACNYIQGMEEELLVE